MRVHRSAPLYTKCKLCTLKDIVYKMAVMQTADGKQVERTNKTENKRETLSESNGPNLCVSSGVFWAGQSEKNSGHSLWSHTDKVSPLEREKEQGKLNQN